MNGTPKKSLSTSAFEAAQGVFLWLDNRLHISHLWEHTAGHPIPKSSASWFYVFGSATLLYPSDRHRQLARFRLRSVRFRGVQ